MTRMLRRTGALALGLATVLAMAAPAGGDSAESSARKYRGYVSLGAGPVHSGSQGAAWTLVFRERVTGRVRYKVCLRHLGSNVRRCYRRRTNSRGRSSIFVARFVNDVGGPGEWRARWRARGKRRASWDFTVRSEGV